MQNLTLLALSSVDKSLTAQTNKQTNTNWYIYTLPIVWIINTKGVDVDSFIYLLNIVQNANVFEWGMVYLN